MSTRLVGSSANAAFSSRPSRRASSGASTTPSRWPCQIVAVPSAPLSAGVLSRPKMRTRSPMDARSGCVVACGVVPFARGSRALSASLNSRPAAWAGGQRRARRDSLAACSASSTSAASSRVDLVASCASLICMLSLRSPSVSKIPAICSSAGCSSSGDSVSGGSIFSSRLPNWRRPSTSASSAAFRAAGGAAFLAAGGGARSAGAVEGATACGIEAIGAIGAAGTIGSCCTSGAT
mmetsp:Transcript_63500/g.189193  ORF Transcript_63500/g.189193 Transcript_63500/m.189193 type:complete len:236 (-) Transcript_63500:1048-1755(-)